MTGARLLRGAGAPFRLFLLGLVRGYRATIGPLLGGRCRFHPTCSAYAAEAIRTRGALVGSALAFWRVLRCQPFAKGGLDPVPERRATPSYASEACMTLSHKEPA